MTLEKPLILSCEHARHRVPSAYADLFRGQEALLATHCGWDIGALELAEYLHARTGAPLFTGEVTRLLVDLNRSVGHPTLHAPFVKALPQPDRQAILDRWHRPYWQSLTEAVEQRQGGGPVVQLALHSFTPELEGRRRTTDIGLLYDPARPLEANFCGRWQQALRAAAPQLRVRCNYPYRGTANSLPTILRRRFPAGAYIGLELEVNQDIPLRGGETWLELQRLLGATLQPLLEASSG